MTVVTIIPATTWAGRQCGESGELVKRDNLGSRSLKTVSIGHPRTGTLSGESEGIARQGWFVEELRVMRKRFGVALMALAASSGWSSTTQAASYGGCGVGRLQPDAGLRHTCGIPHAKTDDHAHVAETQYVPRQVTTTRQLSRRSIVPRQSPRCAPWPNRPAGRTLHRSEADLPDRSAGTALHRQRPVHAPSSRTSPTPCNGR